MRIDWWTLALQAANFLVLVWLLQHFLYRPVLAIIVERQQQTDGVLAEADATRTAAEGLRAGAGGAARRDREGPRPGSGGGACPGQAVDAATLLERARRRRGEAARGRAPADRAGARSRPSKRCGADGDRARRDDRPAARWPSAAEASVDRPVSRARHRPARRTLPSPSADSCSTSSRTATWCGW